jgi:uncharacterized protein with PIN domain
VTEDKEVDEQDTRHQRRCPVCNAIARLDRHIVDPSSNKIHQLYVCGCGQRVWAD